MKKGPLVKVEIRPGQFVKMYEADAIAQGYLKARSKPLDKMQTRPLDKQRAPEPPSTSSGQPEPDDFTTIAGVGPATARALVAHGIVTFEQLRGAGELAYLNERTNRAIEEWRGG